MLKTPIKFISRRLGLSVITLAAALLVLGLAWAAAFAQDESAQRNVLFIYSYEHNVPGYIMAEKGVRQVLDADASVKTRYFSEHMDVARFPEKAHLSELVEQYRRKYAGKKIDLVVVMHAAALDFLNLHGDQLFPGVPVVFGIVPKDVVDKRSLRPHITGVADVPDMEGTLELALKLLPQTERVAVICGSDRLDRALEDAARRIYAPYQERLEITYLSGLPMPVLLEEVSRLPKDTIVVYSSIFVDGLGQAYVPVEALKLISPAANAPVFGAWDTFIGHGMVGGNVASVEQDGLDMGRLGLEIMNRPPGSPLPAARPGKNVMMLDWRQMKRWGLDVDRLPPEAKVMFRERGFWDLYKWEAVGILALLLLETLLLGLLFAQRSRRRKAEDDLRVANEGLERRVAERTVELEGANRLLRDEIGERRHAEEALRESERKFSTVFMCAPIMSAVTVPGNGAFLDANDEFLKRAGWSREELLGRTSTELGWLRVEDRMVLLEALRLDGKVSNFEISTHTRHGEPMDCLYNCELLDIGGSTRIVSMILDITQRKRMEKELHRAVQTLTALIESSPQAIIALDPLGHVTQWNRAAEDIFGWKAEEALGRFLPFIPLDKRDEHDELRRQVLAGGGLSNLEVMRRRKDGSSVWIAVSTAPLRDAEGNVYGILSLISDITDRKQAEEERERLEAQLRQAQKMEAIGTLAGGIAHDFNNILGAILGYAEMARDDAKAGCVDAGDLGQIISAAERAKSLVQRILTFSRKVPPERKPLDLNQEIGRAMELLGRALPKMISVELRLAPDLPLVNADSAQISQVMVNLISNAYQAMPEGGGITISTEGLVLKEKVCQLCGETFSGDWVALTVSDTGPGIDPRDLPRIFDPFFTTKDVGKGTGLGLSTVHGIVISHGGHLDCLSEPERGATFVVYLPQGRWHAATGAGSEPARIDDLAFGGETILLVDDDDSLRQLGARTLRKNGYTVALAESGEEALRIYSEKGGQIDLVVMDLGMPGMGGHKALKAILEINPRAKVMIASGYAANEQVKAALESGAVGNVGKPFKRAEMLEAVRRALDNDLHRR